MKVIIIIIIIVLQLPLEHKAIKKCRHLTRFLPNCLIAPLVLFSAISSVAYLSLFCPCGFPSVASFTIAFSFRRVWSFQFHLVWLSVQLVLFNLSASIVHHLLL
jgi:hypothetical protein